MSSLKLKPALSSGSSKNLVLKKYQDTALKWVLRLYACGLALAPGLGKTVVILLAIRIFKRRRIPHKTLILAKRRIIRKTWPGEITKWGFDLTYALVHGTPAKKRKALESDADVYGMTYESLFWLYSQEPKLWKQFDILVMDESSKIKSWTAKRSKLLRKHINDFARRYCLTGSLQPNTEMDLFNPTYMLDGGERLGRFITAFRNKWFYPSGYEGHDWRLQDGASAEIADAVSDIWLRFGDEELELPPMSTVERFVDLGPRATELYEDLEDEFMAELDAGIIVAPNSGVASGKLRQITGGAIYTRPKQKGDKHGLRPFESFDTEKLDDLEDLLEELNGYPLLIAYEYDHERQRIQERIKVDVWIDQKTELYVAPEVGRGGAKWKGKSRYVKKSIPIPAIGGGTTDREGDELQDAWNAGALTALLGQPDAMAHGLNMQERPAHVCFFACGWNFENHYQFIRRIWRQGIAAPVLVYYIIARDTVDEDVVASNAKKGARENMLYEAIRRRNRNRKGPNVMSKKATTKKAPAKKKAAAKKAPAKKAATAATGKQRLRVKADFRVKRGKAPSEGSMFDNLYKCVHASGSTSIEKIVPQFFKRGASISDAFAAKHGDAAQLAHTRAYVLRAIKAGHLKAA